MRITITQQKEEFKPFALTLEIESEDELVELYNRFNPTKGTIKEVMGFSYKECFSNNSYEIFKILESKLSNDD